MFEKCIYLSLGGLKLLFFNWKLFVDLRKLFVSKKRGSLHRLPCKCTNLEFWRVKNVVDFWWQIFCRSSPRKMRLEMCHRKLHHILQQEKRFITWSSLWEYPHLVAHDCGYPLWRYTCRATRVAADFLDFIAFCRCSTGVALRPLKILVWHLPPCAGRCRTEIWV